MAHIIKLTSSLVQWVFLQSL